MISDYTIVGILFENLDIIYLLYSILNVLVGRFYDTPLIGYPPATMCL